MHVRSLRPDDLPALRTLFNTITPQANGYPATPEEFTQAFGAAPRQILDPVTLVAESGGQPVAFLRAGSYCPVPNRLTFAAVGDGLLFGPFFPRNRHAEATALLSTALNHLRISGCNRILAFDPVEAVSAPFYNGGWAALSERLPHVVGMLARAGFKVRHRELMLSRSEGELPPLPVPPPTVRLALEERGNGRYAVRVKRETVRLGECYFSVMYPSRSRHDHARHCGFIDGLGIDAQHQGQGLGRLALLRALHELQEMACTSVRLTTASDNYRAQNLYFSLGFELVDSCLTLVLG